MKSAALWLLLLVVAAAAGYCAGNRRARDVTRPQLVAADSAVRDAQAHIAGLTRTNHQLADSLEASDSAIARHRLEANRSAEQAGQAEARAATIRANRGTQPPSRATTAQDSIEYFRSEMIEADLEAAALRTALEERKSELAAKESIDRIRQRDLLLLRTAADDATAQLLRVVPALEAARAAIAASEPRCRLPLGLPCPSRKAVALGTALAVVSVHWLVASDRGRDRINGTVAAASRRD